MKFCVCLLVVLEKYLSSPTFFALVVVTCLVSLFSSQPTLASHEYNFPGIGSQSKWNEANILFIKAISLKHCGSPELPDECIDVSKQAISLYPLDSAFYCELAEEYLLRQRFSEAEEAVATAMQLAPRFGRPFLVKAQILMQNGSMCRAIQTLETSAKLDPDDPDVWSSLAAYRSLHLCGFDTSAEEAAMKCLKLVDSGTKFNPFNYPSDIYRVTCFQTLAASCFRQRLYFEAKKLYEQALIADYTNSIHGEIDDCEKKILILKAREEEANSI